jgi:hypothetical protein
MSSSQRVSGLVRRKRVATFGGTQRAIGFGRVVADPWAAGQGAVLSTGYSNNRFPLRPGGFSSLMLLCWRG